MLCDGDLVYENERVTKQKLGKHALAKRRADEEQQNGETTKPAKRRRRPLKPQQNQEEHLQVQQRLEEQLEELQQEQTSLLPTIKREAFVENRGEQLQEELNSLLDEGGAQPQQSVEGSEKKVLRIDLEDGTTLNYVSDIDGTAPDTESTDTLSQDDTVYTVDFIDDAASSIGTPAGSVSEHDIEQILTELAEGSLVLVSSLDAEHEDRVVNEIYMYDKDTGELCEQPLQIPEHIVQSILNVMS